ncbi:MAG: hypothetical protein WED01_03025 [Candidatus Rokuibacteriota bacterium]
MAEDKYDRSTQDVGNIVALEHVNVTIPDQVMATDFWITGMGFTRDPYLMVGTDNMWVNIGQQQFHLPTGPPQVLRGTVDLVVPDIDALVASLAGVRDKLASTRFAYAVERHHVAVTCPWGNRLRCYAPGAWADMTLGMTAVEFPVGPGAAAGIAKFYETVMDAPAAVVEVAGAPAARVRVGGVQALVFRETAEPIAAYDGHHVAVYIADFSGPHRRLREHGLLTRDERDYEYRFTTITDLDTGRPLFEIEHEVRSLTNPLYARPLVNRNPAQRQSTYQRGRDAFVPGMR